MLKILKNSTSPNIDYMNGMVGKTFETYHAWEDYYYVRTARGDWWYFKKEDCYLEGSDMPKPEKQDLVQIERRLLQSLKSSVLVELKQLAHSQAYWKHVAKTAKGQERRMCYEIARKSGKTLRKLEAQMKAIKKALT